MKVGDYVRTKDGIIDEVIIEYNGKCASPTCNCKHVSCEKNYYDDDKFQLDTKHIAEELADVMVMLKQFQYFYEIPDKEIEDVMKYKVQRQLERIKFEEVNDVRAMGEEKKGRR